MAKKAKKTRKKEAVAGKKVVKKNKLNFLIIAGLYLVVWGFLMTVAVVVSVPRMKAEVEVKTKVPVMEISLFNTTKAEVHENGKDVKYTGNTVSVDGQVYGDVEFKGRGNFSWLADKKSYRIKFASKVDLLGMGKAKKWALIANNIDDTLMRNDLAFYLTDMIVGGYPLRGEFVELLIDGEDLGVYYVVKTMEIDKRAVDLKDPMGILVELDNAYCESEEKWYETAMGNCLTVKDVVADDNEDKAMADFVADFNALEKAVTRGDFETVKELADVESFAEYFVISELAANPDAYVTSWFMYKDGVDDKIHAGLAWDFDAAFGNQNWGEWEEGFYAPTTMMARFKYTFKEDKSADKFCSFSREMILSEVVEISRMMCELLNEPEFREVVGEVYDKRVRGKEDEILSYIDWRAEQIREVAVDDKILWEGGDFEAGVEYLKEWVEARLNFFGTMFGTDEGDTPAEMDEV